jgi:8-oxo-dGTP pyrophosphatase MutT (NUDIX family)
MSASRFPSAFQNYQPPTFKVFGAICVSNQDRILLVRGRRSQIYSFPKGHLKDGELAEGCAARELLEETGLRTQGKSMGFYKFSAGSYFLYQFGDEPTPEPKDTWEIDDARWVKLEELDRLPVNVDVSWFRSVMKARGKYKKKEQKGVDAGPPTTPSDSTPSPQPLGPAPCSTDSCAMEFLSSRKARNEVALLWRRRATS